MDGKTNTKASQFSKIGQSKSIKEFAANTVIARRDSQTGIIKISLPPYASKSLELDGNATLFVLDREVYLFPNTWNTNNPALSGITSYALRIELKKGSMVEIDLYSSDTKDGKPDSPSSVSEYPIEAFLTPECVHEFWKKHPIPVWSRDDDISYMRYPFWVYLSHVICRLYSDGVNAAK